MIANWVTWNYSIAEILIGFAVKSFPSPLFLFMGASTQFRMAGNNGGYVEDDLLKRAPSGSTNDRFDKIGFGPTLYTADDCFSNSSVWSPFGDT